MNRIETRCTSCRLYYLTELTVQNFLQQSYKRIWKHLENALESCQASLYFPEMRLAYDSGNESKMVSM